MGLDIDRSIAQSEEMLRDVLELAFKIRKLTVLDVATLRGVQTIAASQTPEFRDGDLVYVTGEANVFRWRQSSKLADDSVNVIGPLDVIGQNLPGRWLRAVSVALWEGVNVATIPEGILRAVIIHMGDFDAKVLQDRIYAQRPCMAIHFGGGDHTPKSQIPGALYDYRQQFEIWSVSRNYRDRNEANLGSNVPEEAAKDPGVSALHGMVKKLLAGISGRELGQPSVKYIELHRERLEHSDLEERVFVMAQEIEILAALDTPDAPILLSRVAEIAAQRLRAQAPARDAYDLANCVTFGLEVVVGLGFTFAVAGGAANIAGAVVVASPTVRTFSASSDTYRDLTPAGTWVFTEVANGETPAAPAVGNLRIGVTITDQVGVAADSFLCSVYAPDPVGDPDIIPTE